MPAAGFQKMQFVVFDQPNDFAGCETGKQNRVVNRDELRARIALLAKKLEALAAAHDENFVAACGGCNFPGAFHYLSRIS